MFGDPWSEEPDDPYGDAEPAEDPGAAPEADLVPEIPDETDADPELMRTFWSLVATLNLGLFAVSLGLLLVGVRGQWTAGGAVFALGVGALALAGHRYRHRND